METKEFIVHEDSYRGIRGVSHRSRLTKLVRLLRELDLPTTGAAIDFGCSNGFIIETLRFAGVPSGDWTFVGLDHSDDLLSLARAKGLQGVRFDRIDLNSTCDDFVAEFDLVMCLETLEHVGDYRAAVRTLEHVCKPGGQIVISVPYEKGFPGIAKYFGRKLIHRNAYEDFFDGKSEIAYLWKLISGGSIDGFRDPPRKGWGPHLGFDNDRFEAHLSSALSHCALVRRDSSFLGFNVFYVFKKFSA